MPYPTRDFLDTFQAGAVRAGQFVDQPSPRERHFGVVVRDIFSDAGWMPAEPVRARDWRDNGTGSLVQSSETTFD